MRPDRTQLVVLPQMAKTYPESAVASTCIESFALVEVHDKLEKKKRRPVGATIQQLHATKREEIKGRYRKKSVAKQRKQDVKKKKGWSLSAEKKKKKKAASNITVTTAGATTARRGTKRHTLAHPKPPHKQPAVRKPNV